MEPGNTVRDYIFEEKIGSGGMGEVWRARHGHLDKVVAIKVIHDSLAEDTQAYERFLREAMVTAKFDNPHIAPIYDFFSLDGHFYLVMAYIEGESLRDLIDRRGRLPVDEAVSISRDVLDALDYAHRQGVIHRDVKPSNILVKPDGTGCLVDFGIALSWGKQRITQFGTNVGTPEYMSPEQIQAEKPPDARADVYSFGCVLYEMLTGRPPFGSQDVDGLTNYTIMNRHVKDKPAPLRSLNPKIDEKTAAVVLRALAKAPNKRFSGCAEMAAALPNPQAPEAVDRPPITENTQNRKLLLAAVVIILLGTVLTSYFGWIDKNPAQLEPKRVSRADSASTGPKAGELVVQEKRGLEDETRNNLAPLKFTQRELDDAIRIGDAQALATIVKNGGQLAHTASEELRKFSASLTVNTVPPGARVRIMDIPPKYYPGIRLLPGRYKIKVDKPGFKTYSKKIYVGGNESLTVNLERLQYSACCHCSITNATGRSRSKSTAAKAKSAAINNCIANDGTPQRCRASCIVAESSSPPACGGESCTDTAGDLYRFVQKCYTDGFDLSSADCSTMGNNLASELGRSHDKLIRQSATVLSKTCTDACIRGAQDESITSFESFANKLCGDSNKSGKTQI